MYVLGCPDAENSCKLGKGPFKRRPGENKGSFTSLSSGDFTSDTIQIGAWKAYNQFRIWDVPLD